MVDDDGSLASLHTHFAELAGCAPAQAVHAHGLPEAIPISIFVFLNLSCEMFAALVVLDRVLMGNDVLFAPEHAFLVNHLL